MLFNPLISAAFTTNTWNRLESAYICFKKFEMSINTKFTWPLDTSVILKFCKWAALEKNLKATTVKTYVCAIATLHKIQNLPDTFSNSYLLKLAIKGAQNLELYSSKSSHNRMAVTLPLLKIIGSKIAQTNWSSLNKQVFWSACCLAFFGSFRMGELLSKFENKFDSATTLLWSDIKIKQDCCIVHIKSPKSGNPNGEYVDIFGFANHNCCPLKSMMMLNSMSKVYRKEGMPVPVFTFDSGKHLTKEKLNSTLRILLKDHIGPVRNNISGHSFRAGIPSTLAKFPNLISDTLIMGWGRWSSNAYLSYTKLKLEQKRCIFKKISDILNKH